MYISSVFIDTPLRIFLLSVFLYVNLFISGCSRLCQIKPPYMLRLGKETILYAAVYELGYTTYIMNMVFRDRITSVGYFSSMNYNSDD